MKDKQREDSLDDKMKGMVDKLLDEDEQDQPKNTPILMINSVPLANPVSRVENVQQKSGSNLGNRLGVSFNAPTMDFSPRGGLGIVNPNKKRYSDNPKLTMHNNMLNNNMNFGSPNTSISIEPLTMNLNNLNINFNKSNSGSGINSQNYGNKSPRMNSTSLNYPTAGQFQKTMSANINSNSIKSCENYLSTSSCTSTHSGEVPMKTRSKRHFDDGNSLIHDIDEMLENKVKLFEKVDDDTLQHFKGNFLKIIKSQNGSRILQKALNRTSKDIFSIIFSEIKFALADLLVDSYANYFCQRFYDYLDFWEKIEFLNNIKEAIVNISNSQIGTYPLQAIIDQMKTKEERKVIIEAVRDHVLEMCQHAQGTHVIEKMILCFQEDSIKYIYDIILENFMFLACHCNGLCVTKKVIACSRNQDYISTVQKILLENANVLVQNSHGNYSIQVALESWEYDYVYPLINLFHNQFFTLSTQKFSSNVVEKCLERGGESVLSKFLDEICHKSKILELMKNPFGNYVVQKALKLSTGFHRGKLTGIIKKHLEKLRDKKLINKWKDILNNISGNTLNLNHANYNNLVVKINKNHHSHGNSPIDSPNNSFNSGHSNHSPMFSNSPVSENSPRSVKSNNSHNSFNSFISNSSFTPQGSVSPSYLIQNIMMNNNISTVNLNNMFAQGGHEPRSGMNSPMLNPQINILPSSPRSPHHFPWNQ